MPKIIPITDLRNTTEISKICHEKDEPVFITKNGYGDLVIMSMEAYERLSEGNEDSGEMPATIKRQQMESNDAPVEK